MSWLAAAGSIVGGLFGAKGASKKAKLERTWAVEDYYRQRADNLSDQKYQFSRLRQAARLGGFNPLSVLAANGDAGMVAPAGIAQTEAANAGAFLGQGIADGALILADTSAKQQAQKLGGEIEQLRAQNNELRDRLTNQTIRPRVGGIYDRPPSVPSLPYALGAPPGSEQVGDIPMPEPLLNRGTGIFLNGAYVRPTPGISPADVSQRDYGDYVSNIDGLQKRFWDAMLHTNDVLYENTGQTLYDYSPRGLSDYMGWTTKGKTYGWRDPLRAFQKTWTNYRNNGFYPG